MSFPRRAPRRIALEIFNSIDQKNGRATKWDLIKILGNEAQFNSWIRDFLVNYKFIKKITESNHYFYRKTSSGELFHQLLKNGKIIEALLKVSGKRLRRSF
jgi:phage anti-repressor protein